MLTSHSATENLVLASVPAADYPVVFENLELITLDFQQVIYHQDQAIDYVYFPLRSVLSLGAIAKEHAMSEVGLIGKESFLGLSLLLGVDHAINQAIVLVPEIAVRLEKDIFLAEVDRPGAFREILLRHTQARLNLYSQNIVCKTHHTIDKQLARWLMSVYDRIDGNELGLTQPLMAKLLGVRRATVTEAAIKLQNAGFINYRRGKITIADPVGLEEFACGCYQVVKSLYSFPSDREPLTNAP